MLLKNLFELSEITLKPYTGPLTYRDLSFITNLYAIEKRQYNECPPMVIDPLKQYFATIITEKGDIVIELFPDVAPIAVNSFVFLAQNGWYVNVPFHRVLEDFMAQGGDPSGTGAGGPGYLFAIEVSSLVSTVTGLNHSDRQCATTPGRSNRPSWGSSAVTISKPVLLSLGVILRPSSIGR